MDRKSTHMLGDELGSYYRTVQVKAWSQLRGARERWIEFRDAERKAQT